MSRKEAIYILIALGAVGVVYYLTIDHDEDCGCDGEA